MKYFMGIRRLPAALIVNCLLVMSSHLSAQKESKITTLKGEVLDMACYMAEGAHGPDHKSCAAGCIKRGSPMGLLTEDGKVYLLVENHDKPDAYAESKKFAGDMVEITGTVSEKGGMLGLIIDSVKAKT